MKSGVKKCKRLNVTWLLTVWGDWLARVTLMESWESCMFHGGFWSLAKSVERLWMSFLYFLLSLGVAGGDQRSWFFGRNLTEIESYSFFKVFMRWLTYASINSFWGNLGRRDDDDDVCEETDFLGKLFPISFRLKMMTNYDGWYVTSFILRLKICRSV